MTRASTGARTPVIEGRERRAYVRHDISLEIDVELARQGMSPHRIVGTTINIGRGGVLMRLEELVHEGAACRVTFHGAEDLIEPQSAHGTILYRRWMEVGTYSVAMQFHQPLVRVSGPYEKRVNGPTRP